MLAEARGQRVLPSVRTVNDLSRKALYGLHFGQFEAVLDKAMKRKGGSGDHFSLLLFFGHTEQEGLADLGRQIFDQLPCPLLKVDFRRREQWGIEALKPLTLKQLKGARRMRLPGRWSSSMPECGATRAGVVATATSWPCWSMRKRRCRPATRRP